MFYKRSDPTISFSPYAYLFVAWIEDSNNMFGVDFDLYSSLLEAIRSINKYTYCSYSTSLLAFGECGPTAAVSSNAIG